MLRCMKENSNLSHTPGFISETDKLEQDEQLDIKNDSNLKSKYPSRKIKAVLVNDIMNTLGRTKQIITPTSDNRIFDIVRLNESIKCFTKCASCNSTGIYLREVRLVGVAHIYELYCESCNDISNYLKKKRRLEILDT